MAEGAHAELHSAVLGRDKNHADFTYEIDHQAADTSSNTTAYNVLDDASRGVFQGKVIVRQDAQHVDAQMQTRAMMLSDGAEMDAKPELEIYADDVACAHGSAIGELDKDAFSSCARAVLMRLRRDICWLPDLLSKCWRILMMRRWLMYFVRYWHKKLPRNLPKPEAA